MIDKLRRWRQRRATRKQMRRIVCACECAIVDLASVCKLLSDSPLIGRQGMVEDFKGTRARLAAVRHQAKAFSSTFADE